MKDLIDPYTSINWSGTKGTVTGVVKLVDDYGDIFGDNEKSGHFYPVKFKEKYYDQQIVVSGRKNGDKTITPTSKDPYLVIRLENFSGNPTAKVSGTDEVVFELDFSGVTLPNVKVMAQNESVGYGEKTASELMNEDVDIQWNGTNGTVTGTFKKVTEWTELPKDPHEGHFFAMKIDEKYIGKPFTFIKGDEDPGSTVQSATKDEMFWILCIDQNKKFTFKSGEDVIAILDFNGVTLNP